MPSYGNITERSQQQGISSSHQELLKATCKEVCHNIYDKTVFVGIEIEVEGIENHPKLYNHLWTPKGDNSLRNGGVEYVSPPIRGDEISRMISLFYDNLPKSAVFSQRTSIHVHVNCLDLTPEQITRFVLLYLLFEKVLYRAIGRDRERNIFCVPLQDTFRVGSLFFDLQHKLPSPHHYRIQEEESRYMGMNLAALHEFGTVEFRQLNGTRDRIKVINWINTLLALRLSALKFETKQLIDQILELNTTSQYRTFAINTFGSDWSWFNQKHLDKDMERGVCAIKYSVLASKFKDALHNSTTSECPAYQWVKRGKKETISVSDSNTQPEGFYDEGFTIPAPQVVLDRLPGPRDAPTFTESIFTLNAMTAPEIRATRPPRRRNT